MFTQTRSTVGAYATISLTTWPVHSSRVARIAVDGIDFRNLMMNDTVLHRHPQRLHRALWTAMTRSASAMWPRMNPDTRWGCGTVTHLAPSAQESPQRLRHLLATGLPTDLPDRPLVRSSTCTSAPVVRQQIRTSPTTLKTATGAREGSQTVNVQFPGQVLNGSSTPRHNRHRTANLACEAACSKYGRTGPECRMVFDVEATSVIGAIDPRRRRRVFAPMPRRATV